MPRIQPVTPPYELETANQLAAMMPPGEAPIALFRTLVKNLPMAHAMNDWGSYELSSRLSLGVRDREIVIDRTCARTGCEYEWGVHVAFFAGRARLDSAQIASLTHGHADDPCWRNERDQLLIRAVDELHDTSDISEALWDSLQAELDENELLDLLLLCGWYHAISYAARATRLSPEPGAPTFSSASA
ncbi:MAG: carboxymuconolactone decarboxylase family protein [Pseudonocardiales bacterium]